MKIAVSADCSTKNNLSCPIHVNRIRKKDLSVSKDSFEEKIVKCRDAISVGGGLYRKLEHLF